MARIDEYRILVHASSPNFSKPDPNGRWEDIGEGYWDDASHAIAFASAEVGDPWIVVNGKGEPVAYGDAHGLQEMRDE